MDRRPTSSSSNSSAASSNGSSTNPAVLAATSVSTTIAAASSVPTSSLVAQSPAPQPSSSSSLPPTLPTSALISMAPNIEINGIMAPYDAALVLIKDIIKLQTTNANTNADEIFVNLETFLEDNAAIFRNLATTVAQRVLNMVLHAHLAALNAKIGALERLATGTAGDNPVVLKVVELIRKLKEYKACIDTHYDTNSTSHPIIPLVTQLATFKKAHLQALLAIAVDITKPITRDTNNYYQHLVTLEKLIRETHAQGAFADLVAHLNRLQRDLLELKNSQMKGSVSTFNFTWNMPQICMDIDNVDKAITSCLGEYGNRLQSASTAQMQMLDRENTARLIESRSRAPSRAISPSRVTREGIVFTNFQPTQKHPSGNFYLMPDQKSKFFEQFCLTLFISPMRRELIWYLFGELKRRGEPTFGVEVKAAAKRALICELLTNFEVDCGTLLQRAPLLPDCIENISVMFTHLARRYGKEYAAADKPLFANKDQVVACLTALKDYLPTPIQSTKQFSQLVISFLSNLFSKDFNQQGKLAEDAALYKLCQTRIQALLEANKNTIEEGVRAYVESLQAKPVTNGMAPK